VENIWGDITLRRFKITPHDKIAQSNFMERAHLWTSGAGQRIGVRLQSPQVPAWLSQQTEWKKMVSGWVLSWLWYVRCALYCLMYYTEKSFFFKDI
jgi:hypothetical protein